jgi:hypothetical protein
VGSAKGGVGAADVEAAIRRDFAETDVPAVRALLATYGLERHERDLDLIRLALLRLVNGDFTALTQWVAWAKLDWRDVLHAVHQTYGTAWQGPFLTKSGS